MRILSIILVLAIIIACPAQTAIEPAIPEQVPAPVQEPSRGERVLMMEATAYCSCAKCCGKSNGITATGVQASSRTIAADWNVLPPGTEVHIEGIGYRVVEDRGGGIKGNKLDVWFPSHQEAWKYGRRQVEVRVLGREYGAK